MYILLLLPLFVVATAQDHENQGDLDSLIHYYNQYTTPPQPGDDSDTTTENNLGVEKRDVKQEATFVYMPKNDSCRTVNNEQGKCVFYNLCNGIDVVSKDEAGMIELSIRRTLCSSYLKVCCPLSDLRSPENLIIPRAITDSKKNESGQMPNSEARRPGCGWRNPDGVGMKTIGGTNGEANYGEFPWVVTVYSQGGPEAILYKGVGSLIHSSVVLTAAHILPNEELPRLLVRAGNWDLYTDKEIYPHQDRDVESRVIHKDFNKGSLFYDIALLFLSKPMDLAPNVGIACLPLPRERVAGGTQCFSSWWPREPVMGASILMKAEVRVVDRNSCRNDLRKTRLGEIFELHTSFMCTRNDNDSCLGVVGGAPLVCPIEFEDGRYMQSGIVAWDVGCEGNMVYVDVSNLRDWIDDKVKGRGYSTREYSFNI
ncbi:phenoloxidase-activating factor 2-like [Hyposmocoma kahamanoa]|uniref:phenoloxidase-activating factor 2-like n=1 Tax=Hyposmocoma kahamanoa TaxID=1477025 RepID=UPI000E6D73CB|nr:phenoloxidase-activating factor 2-like [Hyposmocoma kahamanoa]